MSRFYKDKRKEVFDKIVRMYKDGRTIEDKDGIIFLVSPTKLSITPKDPEKLESMYEETVMKLKKRGLLKYIMCYKEDGKVILGKVI